MNQLTSMKSTMKNTLKSGGTLRGSLGNSRAVSRMGSVANSRAPSRAPTPPSGLPLAATNICFAELLLHPHPCFLHGCAVVNKQSAHSISMRLRHVTLQVFSDWFSARAKTVGLKQECDFLQLVRCFLHKASAMPTCLCPVLAKLYTATQDDVSMRFAAVVHTLQSEAASLLTLMLPVLHSLGLSAVLLLCRSAIVLQKVHQW